MDLRQKRRRTMTRRALMTAAGISLLVGIDQARSEADRLQVEHRQLRLPNWTIGNLRIAFLTDWHLSSERAERRTREAIDQARSHKPDLVLLGGDYISSALRWKPDWMSSCLSDLAALKCPVRGVFGNHDLDARSQIAEMMRDAGMPLLVNEATTLAGLTLVGIDDGITGFPNLEMVPAFRGQSNVVLLFHEPDYAEGLVQNASLTLCGHTHGGQICLPGGFPMHLPKGGRNFVGGTFEIAEKLMYVSRGIGTSGPAVRAFCRPEISILDLRSQ